MNTKIAVAVGVAAVIASIFALPQTAFAADVPVSITPGSSTKTDDAYSPNPVEITVGDTVIWTNNDPGQLHSATSGSDATPTGMFGDPAVAASLLRTNQSESFTFSEAGEFPYYCFLHPNMIGTVKVAGGSMGGGFTVTASLDGNNYEITGKSETIKATAAIIEPSEAIVVTFDKAGEVELTLPKTMISGNIMVEAGDQTITPEIVSEDATATTIKFAVPDGETEVDIIGTTVIPEFPVIAALILGASIAGIVGYTRIAKGGIASFFGRV
ncbi:MAG: plastocyanin/azurin family copper-binding protein [Nitrososphaera sp.]